MSKRAEFIAIHRPNGEGESYQVSIRVDSIYPEVALEEARKQAVTGLRDLVAELRTVYGESTPSEETT